MVFQEKRVRSVKSVEKKKALQRRKETFMSRYDEATSQNRRTTTFGGVNGVQRSPLNLCTLNKNKSHE